MRNLANNMKGENKMMCCCCCMSEHLNTVYFSYALCAPEDENLKEQKKDVDFSGRYCMDAVPAFFYFIGNSEGTSYEIKGTTCRRCALARR